MDEDDQTDGADLIVVLGGDGTTLRALHRSLDSGVPVFAINYGRVGFLTTAPADELETALSRAFSGDYCVVQLPTVDVRREGERCGLGVNDAVVTSALHGRMAHFQWSVNGVDLGEIGCDASSSRRRRARPPTACRPAGRCSAGGSTGWWSRSWRRTR